MNKDQIESIVGTIVAIISIGNLIAKNFGWIPLDISQDVIYNFVSNIAVVCSSIYIWWKNNNVTPDAKLSQKVLNGLKDGEILPNQVNELLENK